MSDPATTLGPRRRRLLLALAVLLLPASLGAAPAKGSPAKRTFEGSSQVVSVEVPINVVDRDGQPVRGLTADDFELWDDGARQEVSGFEVVDLDRIEQDEDAIERQGLPAVARRHFMLLFDLSFSNPSSILKARLAARDFVLHSLHPSDLVAVATYSLETGPQLVMTFTPDRAQLARAIDTLGSPRVLERTGSLDPLHFILSPPDSLQAEVSTAALGSLTDETRRPAREQLQQTQQAVIGRQIEKSDKSFERRRISDWSRALADVGRALDSVPGRKQIVYFSEGFDSSLLLGRQPDGEDQRANIDRINLALGNLWMVDTDDFYGNSGLQRDLESMLEQFRRTDSVIQAVDIGGLRADSSIQRQPARRKSGQEALFYMARATGGTLFEDANDLEDQLSKVIDRSTVTYLLSFEPGELVPDGSYHRLKVRLKGRSDQRRGLTVSSRSGYYAPRPYHDLPPLEKTLLASDAIAAPEPRHDVDLEILAAPFRASERRAYVPVILQIGGASLLAGDDSDHLQVEIYGYVTDDEGRMRDFFSQVLGLDVSRGRASLASGGLKYYAHVNLDPGRYLLRTLVRNATTGRAGVETAALTVPEFDGSQPVLLPPFVLEETSRWLLVREKEGEQFKKSVIYPFTVNGEPYVPAVRPVLREGRPVRFCLVAYNLGSEAPKVAVKVLGPDGRAIPGARISRLERTVTGIAGLDKLLGTFEPHGLAAGEYTLQVALKNSRTGSEETSSLPFAVLR